MNPIHPLKPAMILALLLAIGTAGTAFAKERGPAEPSRKDKCPVCGMFVYKYPDWLAAMEFGDGSAVYFDGVKDLFKYYFSMGKYAPGGSRNDIAAIFVREYYDMDFLEAQEAYFVLGSDVYGPMGNELIPFRTMEDARTFVTDHKGRRILRFEDVTPTVVKGLD